MSIAKNLLTREAFLPGREGHVGGTAADNRLFVDAVLYRYRTDIPWRDLPPRFGDWKIVHQRFSRWVKSGVFERIFKLLVGDPDNEYMRIDATIVRAHQHSGGAQKKRLASDRPFARRTNHQNSCARSTLWAIQSSCCSRRVKIKNPFACAEALIENADPDALIGDKAYDTVPLVITLTQLEIAPAITPKTNRKVQRACDFALYCERNL